MTNKWTLIAVSALFPMLGWCTAAQAEAIPCGLQDVTGKLAGEYTASGHLHSSYSITNTSQHSCLLERPVAFRSVGENDDQSPELPIDSSDHQADNLGQPGLSYPVTLAPGGSVYFLVYRASAINTNLGISCHVEKLSGLNIYINHSQQPIFVPSASGNACLDSTHDIFSSSVLSSANPLANHTAS